MFEVSATTSITIIGASAAFAQTATGSVEIWYKQGSIATNYPGSGDVSVAGGWILALTGSASGVAYPYPMVPITFGSTTIALDANTVYTFVVNGAGSLGGTRYMTGSVGGTNLFTDGTLMIDSSNGRGGTIPSNMQNNPRYFVGSLIYVPVFTFQSFINKQNNNICMGVRSSQTNEGNPLEAAVCNGNNSQKFYVDSLGRIHSKLDTNICVRGDARVGVCTDLTSLQWDLQSDGRIQNKEYGNNIGVPYGCNGVISGWMLQMQQSYSSWGGNCATQQQWTLESPLQYLTSFSFSVHHDSKCAYPDQYDDLYQTDCDGSPSQKYTVFGQGMLKHNNGKCLVADGSVWPKLRDCDPQIANMEFDFVNLGCSNGVCDVKIYLKGTNKCLKLGGINPVNRLLFIDC